MYMQSCYFLQCILILVAASVSSTALLQTNASSLHDQPWSLSGPNSADGLKQFLEDVRTAAKGGDTEKVAAYLKDMEIPNCEAWLHAMYKADSADSWMGLCDSKTLRLREKSMHDLFDQLAGNDGEFLTRKINDNPEPGRGLEWGWLQAIRQPLDIYYARWKSLRDSKDSKGQFVGYFMFIDGAFRWDSGIMDVQPIMGKIAVVPPKPIEKIAPVYPPELAAKNVNGKVRVYFNVGVDGATHDVHALSGEGLSDDPILKKAAEEAVIKWRFEPSTVDGKPAEASGMTADVVFSPRN